LSGPNFEGLFGKSGGLPGWMAQTRLRPGFFSRVRRLAGYLGPAFIVSVAYVDPGNFATNISGGSKFNYDLLWVILWGNLMAIFLQSVSAKLGIAAGMSLPEMCARVFPRSVNWCLWIMAETAAMATNLAEFLGGALGLHLLFKLPLAYAGVLTGALTCFIVHLEKYGQRALETVVTAFVAVICAAYGVELFLAKPDWAAVGTHMLTPSLAGGEAVLVAAGMLGATVMPHVIYLHSQLVQSRKTPDTCGQKLRHYKLEKTDIAIAMNIAFLVNAAMVVVAASVFYAEGIEVKSIEQAHHSLSPLLGSLSSGAFAIALLASGVSSSVVGTMAGQTVMKGFVNLKIPVAVRRIAAMAPALAVILLGADPVKSLIISQVVLSFALPAAIVPLMLITGRKDIMGPLVNGRLTNSFGWVIAALVIGLNAVLLFLTFTGNI